MLCNNGDHIDRIQVFFGKFFLEFLKNVLSGHRGFLGNSKFLNSFAFREMYSSTEGTGPLSFTKTVR